jgi:antitoxin component YwqK of YwqJK toxin-antitoxin module
VLKDQSGKVRAELSTENGLQSSLKFYDETGKKRKEAAQKRARKQTERQVRIYRP